MRPFGVVVDEPGIEIGLECLDAVIEVVPHGQAEDLVEHGAVEAFDEAVGAGCPHLGAAVLDAVEIEIEFVGMPPLSGKLSPILDVK